VSANIINVKGEEGQVRRIHVRATEIETADRASVIIPNSELITGVVKNWTHANTLSRVVVRIGVGYDSDVEKVRDILLEIAGGASAFDDQPGADRAAGTGIADSAISFELMRGGRRYRHAGGVKRHFIRDNCPGSAPRGIAITSPMREVVWRCGRRPVGANS
jgi:small-conductance mechanosensitive channel